MFWKKWETVSLFYHSCMTEVTSAVQLIGKLSLNCLLVDLVFENNIERDAMVFFFMN